MFSTLYTYQILKLFLIVPHSFSFLSLLLVMCLGEAVMCTTDRAALLPVMLKSSTASPCHMWHLTRLGISTSPQMHSSESPCNGQFQPAMDNSCPQCIPERVWPCSRVSLPPWISCEGYRQSAFFLEQGCVALKLSVLSSQQSQLPHRYQWCEVEMRRPR